ncbi:uncharacterized protein LOC106673708 [Cimex lectularius]|uniref:Peptidase aspartic putative domain-containing protein n=1 Tax=Cimex lectularius TaxID=79782 RepID=A0A8I6SBZ1_CIMLE|nr:uncharacterized protein LOC106673708 [Cimex lectularius]
MARMKGPHGQWETIRLVIDCGAQRSFITEDLTNRLQLTLSPNTHQLCGVGEVPINIGKYQTRCVLAPHSSSEPQLTTDAIIIPQISSAMPASLLPNHIKEHFDKFNLADPSFCTPGDIDFLLGADLFGEIILGRKQSTPKNYPQALDTIFGWVVMGPLQHNITSTSIALLANTLSKDDLRGALAKFWSVEEVTQRKHVDPLEIDCKEPFQRTYTRDSDGRYMARLPFIKNHDPFVNTKSIGFKQFYRLEAKLIQQVTLKEKYSQIVKEYLQLGYISRIPEPGRYYFPHHGVLNVISTTELRIDFDASAPGSQDGLSRNSQLHVGFKLQQTSKIFYSHFEYTNSP